MQPLLAAIDVGGTKLGWALGTPEGEVLARGRQPTDPQAPPAPALEALLDELNAAAALQDQDPVALGCAVPGPFLQPEGRFLEVPNLPAWQGFEMAAFLRAAQPLPFVARNDANAGALAEWRWGAGRGASSVLMLTMSTGMGAGLVLDGRLVEGPLGFAGEIGHLRLSPDGPVGFGKRGSVEGYLSGPGMVQVAEQERLRAVQNGQSTCLSGGSLDPQRLCQAAMDGDSAAVCAVGRIATKLGELCALLTDLLNPDVIVVGTIGSAYPELFLPPAREVIEREALPRSAAHVRLVPSQLQARGDQSALALAASLACGELEDAR